MNHLAQQVADVTQGLDWRHTLLAALAVLGPVLVNWFRTSGVKILEDKLRSMGHPQAADAVDLLVEHYAKVATPEEKAALAAAAKAAGIDHPALSDATK